MADPHATAQRIASMVLGHGDTTTADGVAAIDALAADLAAAHTALDRIAKAHAPAEHLQAIARAALAAAGEPEAGP